MTTISDSELLTEVKKRFNFDVEQIQEQKMLMDQLKIVNQKLINSEGLKTNFLSNIRNEINNPISAVLELSKNLLKEDISKKDLTTFSKLIHDEVFYLEFQLRNIFNSAEIEAGESKLSPTVININSFMSSILSSFNHIIIKKNLKVEFSFGSKEELFITDPEKLHLVVSNLISNAVRFCNDNGNITIKAKKIDGLLNIRVKNTGPKMSEGAIKIIFDRFRQIEEGTNKTYSGHGLGLSIVKALLDIMDGEIKLGKELKNETEFIVTLNELQLQSNSLTISEDGNDFLFGDFNDEVF